MPDPTKSSTQTMIITIVAVLIVSEILDARFQMGARGIAGQINAALPASA